MKKWLKILITICLIIVVVITIFNLKNDKEQVLENKSSNKKLNGFISMMVEQSDGTYKANINKEFVSDGYIFNPNKSGCENGGSISWNEKYEKVETSLLTSDKCYAYFDIYTLNKYCEFNKENTLVCELVKKKDNNLIYHDQLKDYAEEENAELEAGDFSYRYTGASNIINNYVCLDNLSSEGKCLNNDGTEGTDNLYRVIGLFKNDKGKYEAKLIKASLYADDDAEATTSSSIIGKGYRWTGSATIEENIWQKSTLNTKTLNQTYYNSLPSEVRRLITSHPYVTGGNTKANLYAKNAYTAFQSEIREPSTDYSSEENLTYDANIGLMYVSDYIYATLPLYWSTKANGYAEDDIKNNDWMYLNDTITREWTITRSSDNTRDCIRVGNTGYVTYSSCYSQIYSVRPVFYFYHQVASIGGFGTYENPYRVKI